MKLLFSFDIHKDVENFKKGIGSINNRNLTKFQEQYVQENGPDFEELKIQKFIEKFLKENNIDVFQKEKEIRENWNSIEETFFQRCDDIFKIKFERNIHVYLTTNSKCTYNTREGYFFVNMMQMKHVNAIIMHELLHFYTHEVFRSELLGKGFYELQYNDIKESLTELLNVEFADLMGGVSDNGYPQHQEMRLKIRNLWNEKRDLEYVIDEMTKS